MKEITNVLILAAGKSRRLKQKKSKIFLKLGKYTFLQLIIKLANKLKPQSINIIIKDKIKNIPKINFFEQKKALGTAHAVNLFLKKSNLKRGKLIILYADTPLISFPDVKKLIKKSKNNDLVLLGFNTKKNNGLGLIKRNKLNKVEKIIEYVTANKKDKKIKLCNSGIMVINNNLFHLIKKIKVNKIKKEYFLTDLINLAVKNNNKVGVVVTKNVLGSMGVNDMNTYIKVKNKYINRYSLK